MGHTVNDLERIKAHLIKSFHFDAGTLFEQSERVDPKEKVFHFGVVRESIAYIEFCGAIYCGWDGQNDRKISTSKKAIKFITEVLG